jgi:hypothetical protein
MARNSTIVLVTFLGAVLGCTSPSEPVCESPPGVADQRDKQVLETALLHLLVAANDFDMMTKVDKRDALIVLQAQTPEDTMLRPEQIRGYIGKGHTIPDDILLDLLRRNEKPGSHDTQVASFSDLKFDQRVVVGDVTVQMRGGDVEADWGAFPKAYPRARGYAKAYLPGYSEDGSSAVVCAFFGPSVNGAMATLLLERRGEKWFVKWCQITRFC